MVSRDIVHWFIVLCLEDVMISVVVLLISVVDPVSSMLKKV